MCAIVGTVASHTRDEPFDTARQHAALETLRHRGPDGQGHFNERGVWLGHARLSIIDLSNSASQPMRSSSGRFVIVYNGEVYNFRELASEYQLGGLRSSSDTEVVLRMFERLGVNSFTKLNGMFAYCVYDRHSDEVWLVRDRLGIKPLYYSLDRDGLAFASEIKGLLALSAESPRCDLPALHEWLYYGNTLGERTLYRGILQLLPGHYLRFNLRTGAVSITAYWSLSSEIAKSGPPDQSAETPAVAVRRRLEDAVRRQLVSDVPVGVFLSGGVDSSAIVAFATRHYQGRLATYSAAFDFAPNAGELPKARRVAQLFGTEHHEIRVAGAEAGDLVETMVRIHDLPFSDAANIPLYLMARQIRGHNKVVLQGDGGDELFGGYRRYATLRYRPALHMLARSLAPLGRWAPRTPLGFRIQRYIRAFGAGDTATTMALLLSPEDRYSSPTGIFAMPVRRAVESADPFARYRQLLPRFSAQDIGNQMSFIDLSIILPDTYLEKVDRSTMAVGLEVRVPFLDNDLVDYVARLSGMIKNPRGRQKYLLKAALKGVVPDDILRGPKTGFSVPYGRWLKTSMQSLFADHLSRFTRAHPDVLDRARIDTLIARTNAGVQDHSPLLWKILNLVVWANSNGMNFGSSTPE